VLRAIKDAQVGAAALPKALTTQRSWESPFEGQTEQERLSERAHQDREIVYFLQQPDTHAFSLYHDYTEARPGVNGYANVVREGSVASHPSARVSRYRRRVAGARDERRGDDSVENQCGRNGGPDRRSEERRVGKECRSRWGTD